MDNTNRTIMLGGIGKPNWKGNDRKTWMQGYRVYDSEGIAITISAKGGVQEAMPDFMQSTKSRKFSE